MLLVVGHLLCSSDNQCVVNFRSLTHANWIILEFDRQTLSVSESSEVIQVICQLDLVKARWINVFSMVTVFSTTGTATSHALTLGLL